MILLAFEESHLAVQSMGGHATVARAPATTATFPTVIASGIDLSIFSTHPNKKRSGFMFWLAALLTVLGRGALAQTVVFPKRTGSLAVQVLAQ